MYGEAAVKQPSQNNQIDKRCDNTTAHYVGAEPLSSKGR